MSKKKQKTMLFDFHSRNELNERTCKRSWIECKPKVQRLFFVVIINLQTTCKQPVSPAVEFAHGMTVSLLILLCCTLEEYHVIFFYENWYFYKKNDLKCRRICLRFFNGFPDIVESCMNNKKESKIVLLLFLLSTHVSLNITTFFK